jgi:hypothetical protein
VKRLAVIVALTLAPLAAASTGADGGLSSAVALLKEKGYFVRSTSTWEPSFRLNMLIGTDARSGDGYAKRAFFFYAGRYLGTDAVRPSAQIEEVWRDEQTIALLYILYRRGEPLCCPTGGGAIVRFHWSGQRLVALDRIPTDDGSAALHR